MSVYVDSSSWKFKSLVMCHMMADSEEELHEFASKLGLKREWFQEREGRGFRAPHYDVCKTKRAEALKLGALEVSSRDLVRLCRDGVKPQTESQPSLF